MIGKDETYRKPEEFSKGLYVEWWTVVMYGFEI